MKINWKAPIVVVLIVGSIYWAVSSLLPISYSASNLNFSIGNGVGTVTNPLYASIPVHLVWSKSHSFIVASATEGITGPSTRPENGSNVTNLFKFELPPGISEFTIARGVDVKFAANTATRLQAMVNPLNADSSPTIIVTIDCCYVGISTQCLQVYWSWLDPRPSPPEAFRSGYAVNCSACCQCQSECHMHSEHLIHTNYRTNRDLTNSGDPCFQARLLGQVQTQFIVIGKEIETMAHVLVVDDEAEIRFLIRTVLESASHNVFEAGDGSAALNILEPPHPFNVIVLDIQMPRMDGIEFLSILHKQISYPPTIVLTAHREKFQKVFEPKVNGYLTKPFKIRELIDMVNSQVNVHIGQPLP